MVSSYKLVTVVMPAAASNLTTLSVFKDDWNVVDESDDAFLTRAITRCSSAISQYCNRAFGVATYQENWRLERAARTGYIISGARSPLQLTYLPVVSPVISIVEQDPVTGWSLTLVEGTDFEADYTGGFLYRLNSAGHPRDWPTCQVIINYQAGFVLPGQKASSYPGAKALPDDIEDACGRLVYTRYAERRRDPLVRSQSVGAGGTTSYWGSSNADGNLTADVEDILNNYRVPVSG
jgi:hypothetical protein